MPVGQDTDGHRMQDREVKTLLAEERPADELGIGSGVRVGAGLRSPHVAVAELEAVSDIRGGKTTTGPRLTQILTQLGIGGEKHMHTGVNTKSVSLKQDKLKTFYNQNFKRKTILGDGRSSTQALLYVEFLPRYYFLGLTSGAQSNNVDLPQTIGWEDAQHKGTPGTFDPLAK